MPVPQWVTNLRTRRDFITQELAEIDNVTERSKFGAKPNFNGEAGGTDHTGYRLSLIQELTAINESLRNAAEIIAADEAAENPGYFEIVTQVDS